MSNFFADDLILQGDRVTEQKQALSDKTLKINLNKNIYGSFSEIGAGQETARHSFPFRTRRYQCNVLLRSGC